MKSLFPIAGWCCLLLLSPVQAATLTVSNYNAAFTGIHGIADAAGTRLGTGAAGVIGRMTLTDEEIQTKVAAGDIAGLNAGFQPFDPVGGSFALNSLGSAGAFEVSLSQDTRASVNALGGSSICVWLYKGVGRTSATEYVLLKLTQTFPTDPEDGLPLGPVEVLVNPASVATVFAGTLGPASHDYNLGAGALALYQMEATGLTGNLPPVASNGVLAAFAGIPKNGQLAATDPEDDPLLFAKVADPLKGALMVNQDGTFTYTAGEGESGQDSFTFKASDGLSDSNIATITVTITPPPPNSAPTAIAASFRGPENDLLTGQLSGEDPEEDPLTFGVVVEPTHAASFVLEEGTGEFRYRPQPGFVGVDSFEFRVNDGDLDSDAVQVTLVVQRGIPVWTWMDGANAPKQTGLYGTQGEPAAENRPGARTAAASASRPGAASYHFGGGGYGETTQLGALNDLWRYDSVSGEWTWLSGDKTVNAAGNPGQRGLAAASNLPGARSAAVLWLDDQDQLWLFGGAASSTQLRNDLWKYDLATGEWTWVHGEDTANAPGSYGSQGVALDGNVPGARSGAVGWRDPSGCLWLFGGTGYGASGSQTGALNDLWKYDPQSNRWTWIKGTNATEAAAFYGARGLPSGVNTPGARTAACAWMGADGHLWLFGGTGRVSASSAGQLNDLWKFDLRSNEWTWVSGANSVNAAGIYGSLGVAAAANTPGARAGASAWLGPDGALLLFGGQGAGYYSDVWSFDPELAQWTWLKGPATVNAAAFYGVQGESSSSATPGARRGAAAFVDGAGDAWLFAGGLSAKSGNDVWRLDLPELPVVRLLPVADITDSGASLAAEVNPNGSEAEVRAYLFKLADGDERLEELGPVGGGGDFQTVEALLTDLDEGTTYGVLVLAESAAGTGMSQVRLFTTAGTPPAVVAEFDEADSEAGEAAGTVNIVVRLSAPAPGPFTLPFSLSGTATPGAAGDYVASPSPLHFLTGQTTASISLTLHDDAVVDVGETVQLELGTPSGIASLDEQTTHVLTIEDNDGPPEFVEPPVSQIVALGSPAGFSAQVSGSPTLAYQWQKNAVNLSKATASSLSFASARLSDGAPYRLVVSNALGLAEATVRLVVVDTANRRIVQPAGSDVTLAVAVAGAETLAYAWFKDDEPLGLTAAALQIDGAEPADSGDYRCEVTLPGTGTLSSGVMRVEIFNVAPVVEGGEAPDGYVGSPYAVTIPIDNLPAGAATLYAATGLPSGLKLNAQTGVVSGVPTAAVTDRIVKVTASNAAGSSGPVEFVFTIHPVPPPVLGSYVGLIEMDPDFGEGLGGRLDLTVTTKGAFSAKLKLGTGKVLSSKGQMLLDGDDTDFSGEAEAAFVRKGQPPLRLEFRIEGSSLNPVRYALSGELLDPSDDETAELTGVRSPGTGQTEAFQGYHTFGMKLPADRVGDLQVPQGHGFGGLTLSANGTASVVGRTADGGSFTVATLLGPEGDIPLRADFTLAPGALQGMPFVALNTPAADDDQVVGALGWTKLAAPVKSKERAYRAGFAGLELAVEGGRYPGVPAGSVVGGLDNQDDNARLAFAEGGLQDGEIEAFVFSIRNLSATGLSQKVTVLPFNDDLDPNPNPWRVAFKLLPKPAGQFSGSFVIPGLTKALNRNATFQGMMVRLSSGDYENLGYFLLAQPPQPGQTGATAPQLSGSVRLESALP